MAGYIGSRVPVVTSGTERKQHYNITTTTTSLTGLQYTPTKVHVFHNGVRLVDGTDYTATTGTSITLTNAAENGDDVVVISYASFQTSDTVSAANGGTFAGNVTMSGDLSVDGGTIKLDGNYPVGTGNVALGDAALDSNVSGASNTAIGADALTATTASQNTAVGYQAAYSNTTGNASTSFGYRAGYTNNQGGSTFVGYLAGELANGASNTLLGASAGNLITTGEKNTVLGRYDGNEGGLDIRTSDNNIVISDGDGNPAIAVYNGLFARFGRMSELPGAYTVSRHMMVNPTSGNAAVEVHHSGGSSPYGLDISFATTKDNNSNWFFRCKDATTNRLYIYSDGDIDNHDNSYSGMSDQKLKQQITDASTQWDDIKALQVRKYKMNEDVEAYGDGDQHWRLGVIAQELEAAGMSGLVVDREDRDENDNDLGTTTKSVKYSILYMKAVKALQEAMDRIETLEAKVTALEAN